jgi:hypothetical protein
MYFDIPVQTDMTEKRETEDMGWTQNNRKSSQKGASPLK